MAIKAIIGHDTTKIGVANEEDSEKVIDFSLVPVCAIVQATDAGNGTGFIGIGLDANAGVVTDTQQVVDDFEALVPGRVVDGGDVGDLGEFSGGVIFQKCHDSNHAFRGDVDGELIFPNRELLDVFGKTGQEVLSVGVKGLALRFGLVGWIDNGCVEFALRRALCLLEIGQWREGIGVKYIDLRVGWGIQVDWRLRHSRLVV